MDKKILVLPILTLAIVLSAVAYKPLYQTAMTEYTKDVGGQCLYVDYLPGIHPGYPNGGQNIFIGCNHNTVTNVLKNQTRDIRSSVFNCTATNCTWSAMLLSTGTTAPAATDTTCEATVQTTNGASAVNATISTTSLSVGNYSLSNKFSFTGAVNSLDKVCIGNSTSTTTPIAASSLFSSVLSFVNTENLTVNYYIADT